ncbi:hypothetical protein QBL02_10845 [Leucobacter sp. UT-8R-CII-1-4]|uniref:hypothetical protein n=1 Tax=Leucobacter sp. UT-8R-CII-1-4 TaxID=3040075 RepID=UPI0024A808FF|nr:hypothetical protein [Leucobacter sp. UT-8R-CII-1-4]MDI6024042.1 hypothetical protein [Leucobacter sp. UT-8R-CII-1-4]
MANRGWRSTVAGLLGFVLLGGLLTGCTVDNPTEATADAAENEVSSKDQFTQPDSTTLAQYRDARAAILNQQGIQTQLEVAQDGKPALSGVVQVSGDLLSWHGQFLLGAFPIEIVRIGDTAWISAPREYWLSYGVPEVQANEIGSKFAVFSGEQASALISFADMTVFLQSLGSSILLNDPTMIDSGDHAGALSVTVEGAQQRFQLSDSVPWFDSVQADLGEGVLSVVTLSPMQEAPIISTPTSAEVFSQQLELGRMSNNS